MFSEVHHSHRGTVDMTVDGKPGGTILYVAGYLIRITTMDALLL